jgi:HEAT repeat protein
MEPVYGGFEDSATHLRANSFIALVQCTDILRFEIFQHLVDGMCDQFEPVRSEAVRAIHQLGGDEAVLLLRLKARLGDTEARIIGHVFDALLGLQRERAVPFVAGYLKSAGEEIRDEAALALGASRLEAGLKVLMDAWQEARIGSFSGVLLRGISSSRLDEAIDFLLELVRDGAPRESAAALEALRIHEDSPELQARIKHAVQSK